MAPAKSTAKIWGYHFTCEKAPSLLGLAVASVVAGVFAVYYFSAAFPIVSLDLQADRGDALAVARRLRASALALHSSNGSSDATTAHAQLGPLLRPVVGGGGAGIMEAAGFDGDSSVQHFVELAGGGNKAFEGIIERGSSSAAGGWYTPYKWTVRHFRPGDESESHVYVTPSGALNGFFTKVPEAESGPSLDSDAARAIAEACAAQPPFALDVGGKDSGKTFQLVESSDEKRLGGRTDHQFVYETSDPISPGEGQLHTGDARYRLELQVAGAACVGIGHSVRVPEAFSRTYTSMRSENNAVAAVANIAMGIVYGIGGVAGGIFYLHRRGATLFRPAFKWGGLLSILMAGASFSGLPLQWLSYDTSLAVSVFYTTFLINLAVSFVFLGILAGVSIAAAEGLARCADDQGRLGHLQFYSLLTVPRVACSPLVLRQVTQGYLLVPIMFAYEVAFYQIMVQRVGWWSPSSPLIDPNVAAMHMPSVAAVGQSLFAGLWEECLFRAVPIAGGLLLARRFSPHAPATEQPAVLAVIFVLQAVIFGAAHANYPAQPSFARLVELLLPSAGFGLLFLRHGLLPGVVLHYIYDLVWFAMPLFFTPWSTLLLDKLVVIFAALAPLAVLILRRAQHAGDTRGEAASQDGAVLEDFGHPYWFRDARARATRAAEEVEAKEDAKRAKGSAQPARRRPAVPGAVVKVLAFAAPALLGALFVFPLRAEIAWAPISRAKALAFALGQMRKDSATGGGGVVLPLDQPGAGTDAGTGGPAGGSGDAPGLLLKPGFSHAEAMVGSPTTANYFVWETAGKESYSALIDAGFLPHAQWQVRFAQFDDGAAQANTTIADRAEEWSVSVPSAIASSPPAVAMIQHTVPEARAGQNLTADQARGVVESRLRKEGLRVRAAQEAQDARCTTVVEVSAMPEKLESRIDWYFELSCGARNKANRADGAAENPPANPLPAAAAMTRTTANDDGAASPFGLVEGDARIAVGVTGSGDNVHVVFFDRFIKVPNAWLRAQNNANTMHGLVQGLMALVTKLVFLVAAGRGLLAWSRNCGSLQMPSQVFWGYFAAMVVSDGLLLANSWPMTEFSLSTSSPKTNQIISALGGRLVMVLAQNGCIALVLSYMFCMDWRVEQHCLLADQHARDLDQAGAKRKHKSTTPVNLAAIVMVAFPCGVVLCTQRGLYMMAPAAANVLPISFASIGAGLMNADSMLLKLALGMFKAVVVQSTGYLLFFSMLDQAAAKNTERTYTVLDAARSVLGSAKAMCLAIVMGLLHTSAMSRSFIDVLHEPAYFAVAVLVHVCMVIALFSVVGQYHFHIIPCATGCMACVQLVFMLQLGTGMQEAALLAEPGFDSLANAVGVACLVCVGTGMLLTRQLEHTR